MDRLRVSWSVLVLVVLVFASGAASGAVHSKEVEYKDGETVLWGYLAYDDSFEGKRPGVLIVHDWRGQGEHEEAVALELAKLGYAAFVVDMFGRHTLKGNPREAGRWVEWFKGHRAETRTRFEAGLDAMRAQDRVDAERIMAVGYGFGGEICLEMARMGVALGGIVCFYSPLKTSVPDELRKPVTSRILVLHGAEDARVTREEVAAFRDEMRAADGAADWQFITYGGAKHAFADPGAQGPDSAYDETAARRSWEALKAFLAEIFAEASSEEESTGAVGQDSQD